MKKESVTKRILQSIDTRGGLRKRTETQDVVGWADKDRVWTKEDLDRHHRAGKAGDVRRALKSERRSDGAHRFVNVKDKNGQGYIDFDNVTPTQARSVLANYDTIIEACVVARKTCNSRWVELDLFGERTEAKPKSKRKRRTS